jgi:hypothetical protein
MIGGGIRVFLALYFAGLTSGHLEQCPSPRRLGRL